MPNTVLGFPYPANTDPVAQGAAAIQALAQAVNNTSGVCAMGQVNLSDTVNNSATATITFPASRFQAPPQVMVSAGSGFVVTFTQVPTVSGVTIGIRRWDNAPIGATAIVTRWLAVQV